MTRTPVGIEKTYPELLAAHEAARQAKDDVLVRGMANVRDASAGGFAHEHAVAGAGRASTAGGLSDTPA
jgi:hypothetical protein